VERMLPNWCRSTGDQSSVRKRQNRVVFLNARRSDLDRVRTQIPLVNHAIAACHEGHDAGFCVLNRRCQDGEAAGHLAIHDVALGAAGGVVALSSQDAQRVAIDDQRFIRRERRERRLGEFAEARERTRNLLLRRGPIQPILFARSADDALGEFSRIATGGKINLLCAGERGTGVDR
jgi:hypothetical protein